MKQKGIRPFLKWPGGKYLIKQVILDLLPTGNRLIEPFVGAGAIFLNADYPHFTLNDTNHDLINIYKVLQSTGESFIKDCQHFFTNDYNQKKRYYELRTLFNQTTDQYLRAQLFLYLNRHGYNGLCRYNRQGGYNVPFGRYTKPYFPEKEMIIFHDKAKKATFLNKDFSQVMQQARQHNVIYCDPPYVPLSATANFTNYSPNSFTIMQQQQLAQLAKQLSSKNIKVLISNHHTPFTQQAYQGAQISAINVRRSISCKGQQRQKIDEILALF